MAEILKKTAAQVSDVQQLTDLTPCSSDLILRCRLDRQAATSSFQQRPVPGSATHRISFDGDWTEIEQRTVERAIAAAEMGRGCDLMARLTGWLWFCYCKRLDDRAVYVAHRAGWSEVLYAFGAAELGAKILTQQRPNA